MSRKLKKSLEALVPRLTPAVAKAFLEAIQGVKDTTSLALLIRAIERGSVDEVMAVLQLDAADFLPVRRALESAYSQAGTTTAAAMGRVPSSEPGLTMLVRFGGAVKGAQDWVSENFPKIADELVASQRELITSMINRGLQNGANPRTTALDLIGRVNRATGRRTGGVLGLNSHLHGHLVSAQSEIGLSSPASLRNYLSRQLRDRRYDRVVRQAIKSGRPISKDVQDSILRGYSNRLLKYRGDVIARTHTMSALNNGRKDAFIQAMTLGEIDERYVTRVWRSSGDDGHTRETHLQMDGQVVEGMRAPFVSPSGARMMHPTDTNLGAPLEEVIQCRCYEEIKIDYVKALRGRRA